MAGEATWLKIRYFLDGSWPHRDFIADHSSEKLLGQLLRFSLGQLLWGLLRRQHWESLMMRAG